MNAERQAANERGARPRTRSPRARRPRVADLAAALLIGALLATLLIVPRTGAAFSSTTANAGNALAADAIDPPTALGAVGGPNVSLSWTATVDTYADGHRIYRAGTTGGPYTQVAEITPRGTVGHVDTPAAGIYFYVARAFAGSWESINSNEVSASVGPPDDYDGVIAVADNCPITFNIDQFDSDGDGFGDPCDPSPTLASSGLFTDSGQSLGTAVSEGVAFGDVDGDGDLDAMIANNGPNALWLNDGSAGFADSGQSLGTGGSYSVALGDLDSDGDLDAMIGNYAQANRVWLNNGAGTFTDSGQTLGAADTYRAVLGDVDGDGDLDAMVANRGPNHVWLNDGTGTYTDSGQSLGAATSFRVVLGDVDGDLDLDAVVANIGQPNVVWVNDGTGTYTDSGQSLGVASSYGIDLGDVDGDGDLDAMVGNNGANTLWLNDGAGSFTDSGQAFGSASTFDVAFGDIDGDGDLDAMTGNVAPGPDAVWVNDGVGTFTDSGQVLDAFDTFDLALADLDADGDLDAMAVNINVGNTVWLNDAAPRVGLADTWQSGLTHVAAPGSDRMLVFVATNEQQAASTPSLTGVSYGGQPMTHIASGEEIFSGIVSRVEIWVLNEAGIAAAAGTSFSPTWSAAPDVPMYSHAFYDNVDQSTPIAARAAGKAAGDTPNPVPVSPVATADGDMVIAAAVAGESGTYTPQNGFTLGLTQDTTVGGTSTHASAYKAATGANETVSMLFNPANPPWTNRQVVLAIVLNHTP